MQGKREKPFSVMCRESLFNMFLEKRSRDRGVWNQSEATQMDQGITNLAVYIPLFILL